MYYKHDLSRYLIVEINNTTDIYVQNKVANLT